MAQMLLVWRVWRERDLEKAVEVGGKMGVDEGDVRELLGIVRGVVGKGPWGMVDPKKGIERFEDLKGRGGESGRKIGGRKKEGGMKGEVGEDDERGSRVEQS